MAVVTTKSAQITNLDALPQVQNTGGEGGPQFLKHNSDTVGAVVGDSANSIYRFVRIPTDAKVKRVWTTVVGNTGTVSVDIGVAWSDSPYENTFLQAFAGAMVTIAAGADNKLFGSAIAITGTAAVVKTDRTFAGTFTASMQNIPLWQILINLGSTLFTSDPGGMFDMCFKITTAAATANTTHSMEVEWEE